ncbi:MAG: heavy metal translocating P-type ATPase, partial [Clostridia bacterium]|nr:heavy metal translocating P-type ATPase [Clostridia bacterium]
MRQYTITGMSCAACAARIEKAVSALDGVDGCSVSLLTNSMGVDGTAKDNEIIKAVTGAGYGAAVKGVTGTQGAENDDDLLEDRETPVLQKRLILSLGFLAALMYFSMGHRMWGWRIPGFFSQNPLAQGLVQMLLAATVMLINKKFFVSGVKGVIHGSPNMDTLVSLGSSVSFIWSVYALFMMSDALVHSGVAEAAVWLGELYFESAAMILVLITVGKLLEAKSKGRTTNALKSLIKLKPKTAAVIRDGKEMTVPVQQVSPGDEFTVKPGESIPVDGVIVEGVTAVNESALTGESIPVDKSQGDTVCAATVNVSGFIRCRATRVGEDTALSQIIRLVSDAAATKAPVARLADKVSGIFVPCVTGIAVITLAAWLIAGKGLDYALARAVSVLVISCPCALGLATPVAVMTGSGAAARHGILFKTAVALEQTGKTQIIALDKTGTVTVGEPEVKDIIPAPGITENELLTAAYSAELKSEHPLAGAVVREAERREIKSEAVTEFSALPGSGFSAVMNGERIYGGSREFIASVVSFPDEFKAETEKQADMGRTPLFFARESGMLGMIAVADTVRQESVQAVRELKSMGIEVVMLTGDNMRTAKAVGRQAEIENVIACVLPGEKQTVISRLKTVGKTAMAGDGIN